MLETFLDQSLVMALPPKLDFFTTSIGRLRLPPEDLEKIEKKMQELVQQQHLPPTRASFCLEIRGCRSLKKKSDFMKCHFIEQFTKPDEKIFDLSHRKIH